LTREPIVLASVIWGVAFVTVIGLVLGGYAHCDPYLTYAEAARRFLAHQPLYETNTIDHFQYLPHAAMVFAPFAWLGTPAGDIAWRAIGWSLFALGVWRLARLSPAPSGKNFLVATCLTIAPAIGSLANGQANLAIAALTLHAAADLIAQRWWRATVALTAGLALKPLMAVIALLVLALHRPMRWRIPIALGVLFVAPWVAIGDHQYVMIQYRDFLHKMQLSGAPNRLFEDVRGLAWTLGWHMPHSILMVLRVFAALGTLWACVLARRRFLEPHASELVAAFAVAYLMLFNPRTQANSYVMAAPFAALFAARYRSIAMLAIVISWSTHPRVLRFTEYWLKPLACVCFCVLLIKEVLQEDVRPSRVGQCAEPSSKTSPDRHLF
jgi:hypothetical protein